MNKLSNFYLKIDLEMFLDDANDQDGDEMERDNGYPTNDDIYTDQE